MPDVGLVPFVDFFPEKGLAETSVMIVKGEPGLPDDEYGLLESYCADPQCHCRRVMLNVIARRQKTIMATINYGFDRDDELAGPFLDPLNPQSTYSDVLLRLVSQILEDPAYVDRLERHYDQVKQAAADPNHPAQSMLARLARAQAIADGERRVKVETTGGARQRKSKGGSSDRTREESVPRALQALYESVTDRTNAFCKEHLDDEYAQLCRKLTAALCRKRPSPLGQGRSDIWAAAIVYAIGTVNFLFDKTQTPHLSAGELCELMGTSQRTTAAKARKILDLFGIVQFDPRWCRPSKLDDNPLAWMIEVDGFIVDVRTQPRELQEEAYRRGLIPYLP